MINVGRLGHAAQKALVQSATAATAISPENNSSNDDAQQQQQQSRRTALRTIVDLIEGGPVPVSLFDRLIKSIDQSVKQIYSSPNISETDRGMIEKRMLITGEIPQVLVPATVQLFGKTIPSLMTMEEGKEDKGGDEGGKMDGGGKKGMDPAKAYFADYSWLGLCDDRRTMSFERDHIVDVMRKIIIPRHRHAHSHQRRRARGDSGRGMIGANAGTTNPTINPNVNVSGGGGGGGNLAAGTSHLGTNDANSANATTAVVSTGPSNAIIANVGSTSNDNGGGGAGAGVAGGGGGGGPSMGHGKDEEIRMRQCTRCGSVMEEPLPVNSVSSRGSSAAGAPGGSATTGSTVNAGGGGGPGSGGSGGSGGGGGMINWMTSVQKMCLCGSLWMQIASHEL